MNTIEILDIKDCCGCSSCAQKCPKGAITMVENNEGFLYPKLDKNKCIKCGLCSKACPQLKKIIENKGNIYPKAYGMYIKDEDTLNKSSSGGVFSAIANYILENDGVVFGAAYNKDLSVNHTKVEKKEDLYKLRTSKYVQSNINGVYKEIEELLKRDIKVFFVGTPCQVAGLKAFLGKEYNNLLTSDLVCHGVPSQKLFLTYIDYLSNKYKSKITEFNFRSKKTKGWGITGEVSTKSGKKKFIDTSFDPYYTSFFEAATYRESCYICHYSNINRVSDITLADYWGIEKIHPDFYNQNGNSLILVNTVKGDNIIHEINKKVNYVETDIDFAIENNYNLHHQSNRPNKRNYIYNGITELSSKDYIKKNLKVKITPIKLLKIIIPNKVKKKIKTLIIKVKCK